MKKLYLLISILISTNFIVNAQNYTKTTISTDHAGGAFGLVEFDINNNNLFDLISASQTDNTVAYYINNGDGTFTQHNIDTNLTGATYAFAGDFNGDDDLDFVAVGSGELVWYENDGSFNFTKHHIDNLSGASFVVAYDIDNDNDDDIGVAISGENYIAAFLNDGSASFTRLNGIGANNPKMFHGGDFNNDGTSDILVPSFDDDSIVWKYFNGYFFVTGGTVTSNFDGVWWAEGADVDGDSDWDVVAAAYNGNKISWFESDGTGTGFTEHIIDSNINHPMYLRTIDLDNDSDMDIVATGNGTNGTGSEVAIYINDGNNNFTKTTVDNVEQGPACVSVRDFTGNGNPDIAFASNMSNKYVLLASQTNSVTGINNKGFSVFPNPANKFVEIKSENSIIKLELYDITGRKVLEQTNRKINISNFKKGNYFVKVIFKNGKNSTKKLIIN